MLIAMNYAFCKFRIVMIFQNVIFLGQTGVEFSWKNTNFRRIQGTRLNFSELVS